jgi:hypothetical protein
MRFYLYLLLLALPSSGCKKNSPASPQDSTTPPAHKIRVLERSTYVPVKNATVYFQNCNAQDILGFCTSYTVVKVLTTDDSGYVTVKIAYESIKMEHQNYWPVIVKGQDTIIATPKSLIKVNARKVNTYLPDDFLKVSNSEPGCYDIYCWSATPVYISTGSDTAVYVSGRGNAENEVHWQIWNSGVVTSGDHSISPIYINRFDTATINLDY